MSLKHPVHTAIANAETRAERLANRVDDATGTLTAVTLAVLIVLVWAAVGPYFRYSDTWQLAINTGTTIATFLLAFLIKFGQRRQSEHARMIADATYADTEMLKQLIQADTDLTKAVHDLTEAIHAHVLGGQS